MNQGSILTPVAKGYSSKDYIKTEAFVKRNTFEVAIITMGVVIIAAGFIYRSQIVGQLRNWIKTF